MKRIKLIAIAGLLVSAPAMAAPGDMNVATFLAKATRCGPKGRARFSHPI